LFLLFCFARACADFRGFPPPGVGSLVDHCASIVCPLLNSALLSAVALVAKILPNCVVCWVEGTVACVYINARASTRHLEHLLAVKRAC
jgi:hypothetical protein